MAVPPWWERGQLQTDILSNFESSRLLVREIGRAVTQIKHNKGETVDPGVVTTETGEKRREESTNKLQQDYTFMNDQKNQIIVNQYVAEEWTANITLIMIETTLNIKKQVREIKCRVLQSRKSSCFSSACI